MSANRSPKVKPLMSISLFRTLIAIAETGSFSAAATRVFVTHAAVGQQMKRLEDQLGVALFDRSEKSPRLNQLGKALVPKAREVVAAYDTILDDLTGDPALIGELTLGAVPSTIRGLIPQVIKRLITNYPELRVRVTPGLTPDLQEQVERGSVDAAVLSKPARVGRHMNWQPFVEERLILLAAPEVTEDDPARIFATMPYIRHTTKSSVGILAEDWLVAQKIEVNDMMEMGSLENLATMVAHNLGVSVVPDICVPDPIFDALRKIPRADHTHARAWGADTGRLLQDAVGRKIAR
ncbi:LysR family transcriptional regulator [Roseovarius sp. C7]|uniref:LysR family transcriptional regulator n=1 Tax=Roseovarius sp. C7 TaxID=3398643 RepID=UPI0039F4D5CF